jgi:hypothetical protein
VRSGLQSIAKAMLPSRAARCRTPASQTSYGMMRSSACGALIEETRGGTRPRSSFLVRGARTFSDGDAVRRHAATPGRGIVDVCCSSAAHSKYAISASSLSRNTRSRPASTLRFKYTEASVPIVDTTSSCASARVAIAGSIAPSRRSSTSLNASSITPKVERAAVTGGLGRREHVELRAADGSRCLRTLARDARSIGRSEDAALDHRKLIFEHLLARVEPGLRGVRDALRLAPHEAPVEFPRQDERRFAVLARDRDDHFAVRRDEQSRRSR